MINKSHCCPQCDKEANERESKLADQCMLQHDMIKAQAEIIDNLREEIKELKCQLPAQV